VGDGNTLTGNYVGVDAVNHKGKANGWGVSVSGSDNVIVQNVIARNSHTGVGVSFGAGNTIRANSIYSNGVLGINLGADGVTANDVGDTDVGPNGWQNFPVLLLAEGGATTRVVGTLNTFASATVTIDFYASTFRDADGNLADGWRGCFR